MSDESNEPGSSKEHSFSRAIKVQALGLQTVSDESKWVGLSEGHGFSRAIKPHKIAGL